MKLQKLVWLTHGFHLGFFDAPAVDDVFEAWPYGPVCPPLYYATSSYGSLPVVDVIDRDRNAPRISAIATGSTEEAVRLKELVEGIVDAYGNFTAIELSSLTHLPGSPWYQVVEEIRQKHHREIRASDHEAIRNSAIEDYFKQWIADGTPPKA